MRSGIVTPFPARRPPSPPDDDDEPRQTPIEPFEPFYASEMEGRDPPPREWLIDGVAQRGTVMLFAGAAKIGKSLLMQQMLTSTALGLPWLDRDCVRARALGLYGEDSQGELERRQAGINAHLDRSPADYELDLVWKSLEGRDATLVNFGRDGRPKMTPLFHQIKAFVRDRGIQVIGLDNARVIFGGNENWPNQVTLFVRMLVQWAIEISGLVVLAAHPGKNDPRGFAGTGAWLASVRAGMSLRRPDDWEFDKHGLHDPRRVLSGLGANYGVGIGNERVDIQDGVFVLADEEKRFRPHQGPLNQQQRQDMRYQLLVIMRRFLNNGGKVMADPTHRNALPALVRRSPNPEINRITLNDVELMQQEMLDAGQVVRVDVGRKMLLRPADGPYYDDEQPWLPAPAPTPYQEAAE